MPSGRRHVGRLVPKLRRFGRRMSAASARAEFDLPLDTEYAHADEAFSGVFHVFAREWYGIRACAGFLPGRKVALAAEAYVSDADIAAAAERILAAGARRIVLQGLSQNKGRLARALRAKSPETGICLIWHGTTAQFHYDFEPETLTLGLALRREGVIDTIAGVKPDIHLASDLIEPLTMINVPPNVGPWPRTLRTEQMVALLPASTDWRKNFYTNLYAALHVPEIERVHCFNDHIHYGAFLNGAAFFEHNVLKNMAGGGHDKIVVREGHQSRAELFAALAGADLCFYATLSECQPMVALEALAFGVPCLTCELGLGAIDAHLFARLTQVRHTDNIRVLADAAGTLVGEIRRDPGALAEAMADYGTLVRRESLARYAALLGL